MYKNRLNLNKFIREGNGFTKNELTTKDSVSKIVTLSYLNIRFTF